MRIAAFLSYDARMEGTTICFFPHTPAHQLAPEGQAPALSTADAPKPFVSNLGPAVDESNTSEQAYVPAPWPHARKNETGTGGNEGKQLDRHRCNQAFMVYLLWS